MIPALFFRSEDQEENDDEPDRHAEQPQGQSFEHRYSPFSCRSEPTEDVGKDGVVVAVIAALLGRPIGADGRHQR